MNWGYDLCEGIREAHTASRNPSGGPGKKFSRCATSHPSVASIIDMVSILPFTLTATVGLCRFLCVLIWLTCRFLAQRSTCDVTLVGILPFRSPAKQSFLSSKRYQTDDGILDAGYASCLHQPHTLLTTPCPHQP